MTFSFDRGRDTPPPRTERKGLLDRLIALFSLRRNDAVRLDPIRAFEVTEEARQRRRAAAADADKPFLPDY